MFPKTVVMAIAVVAIATVAHARPEPPSESHSHPDHGYGNSDSSTKVKPAGPSKIFGWLGSRFAKIPQYIPRFPHFPKYNIPQKLPAYQAVILPEPPKSGYGAKGKLPEKVKISPIKQTYSPVSYTPSGYSSLPPSAFDISSYSPMPSSGYSVQSHSIPSSGYNNVQSVSMQSGYDSGSSHSPSIEVLQSTLLYHNKEVLPASPISSPPVNNHQSEYFPPQSQFSYTTIPYNKPDSSSSHKSKGTSAFPNQQHSSHSSHYSAPSSQSYKAPAAPPVSYTPLKQQSSAMVPIVPQSMGPDYFDTAYRSPAQLQEYGQAQFAAANYQSESYTDTSFPKQFQSAVEIPMSSYFTASEANQYTQVKEQPPLQQQLYAVKQNQPSQQYSTATQSQSASYEANNDGSIHAFANQALGNQPLSTLISSIQGDEYSGQRTNYVNYQVPATGSHSQAIDDNGGSRYSEAETPGVKILSQGTESGNPVFEVIADANAPNYNGHPFDINKLIAMIEPGAQLESADLSHAASETKASYLAPVNASPAEDAAAAAQASHQTHQSSADRG